MRRLHSGGPSISWSWLVSTDWLQAADHISFEPNISASFQITSLSHIFNPYITRLSVRMLKRDNVKSLTKINHIHGSPLTHQAFHLIMESYQAGQTQFPFDKSVLTAADHLSFKCLETVFRISYSITFPGIKARPACLQLLGFFLPFLKPWVTLALLQCSGTSPQSHDFSEIIKSSLTKISDNPLVHPIWAHGVVFDQFL